MKHWQLNKRRRCLVCFQLPISIYIYLLWNAIWHDGERKRENGIFINNIIIQHFVVRAKRLKARTISMLLSWRKPRSCSKKSRRRRSMTSFKFGAAEKDFTGKKKLLLFFSIKFKFITAKSLFIVSIVV